MATPGSDQPKAGLIRRLYDEGGLSAPLIPVLIVGALLVPALPGVFWTEVGTEILILGLFAMSFNMIYGYMGQISFGHAAFFGLGAYATAILFRDFSGGTGEITTWQFFASLLVALPVAALGALIVGFFSVSLLVYASWDQSLMAIEVWEKTGSAWDPPMYGIIKPAITIGAVLVVLANIGLAAKMLKGED